MRDQRATPGPDVPLETAKMASGLHEFTETARALVALFERGLDHRSDIVGWHGTSLDAIERALLTGTLPGSAVAHGDAAAGHLFFYPPTAKDFASLRDLQQQAVGRGGAMRYADGNARAAYFMSQIGLDFRDFNHQRLAHQMIDHACGGSPDGDLALKALEKLGISRDTAIGEATQANQRHGVLIALSQEALTCFTASDGDVPGEDLKIFVPLGLPLSCIAGIEPLGEVELNYFETLQLLLPKLSSKR